MSLTVLQGERSAVHRLALGRPSAWQAGHTAATAAVDAAAKAGAQLQAPHVADDCRGIKGLLRRQDRSVRTLFLLNQFGQEREKWWSPTLRFHVNSNIALWRTSVLQTGFTAGLNAFPCTSLFTHVSVPPHAHPPFTLAPQLTLPPHNRTMCPPAPRSNPPPPQPWLSTTVSYENSLPALQDIEREVCQMFRKQKIRKAPVPVSVSPSCPRAGTE